MLAISRRWATIWGRVIRYMAGWKWLEGEPKQHEVNGAYLSPFRNRRITPEERKGVPPYVRRVIQGCAYSQAGLKISASERQGGFGGDHVTAINPAEIQIPSRNVKTLEGSSLYLGHHMNHYGHFLTEFLPRLWSPVDFGSFDHIVAYPFIFGRPIQSYHRDLAKRIVGFDLFSRLTLTQGDLLFESLSIPESLVHLNQAIHPAVSGVYGAAVARDDTEALDDLSGRIFLSRSSKLRNQRISNASDVESVFSELDFKILYPEDLSIDEQLKYYSAAKIIAGFSGSGMHNIVFSSPGTILIEVGDQRAPRGFLKTQAMLNAASSAKAFKIPFFQSTTSDKLDLAQLRDRLVSILKQSKCKVQA